MPQKTNSKRFENLFIRIWSLFRVSYFKFRICLLILSILTGCSRAKAQTYLLIAPHHRDSQAICADYLKAYYHDASAFKLQHIGRAVDACLLAQDFETAESFLKFQDRYRTSHLGEALKREAWVEDQSRVLRKKVNPLPKEVPATGTKPSIVRK